MRYINGKQVKIVTGTSAFDFETKLNAILTDLNNRGVQYELQMNPATGLVAYIVHEDNRLIPETMKEEFEQGGESHTCVECPYFIMPTDGRRKYTKCPRQQGLAYRERACCEKFYEELSEGKLTLREVWHG